MSENTNGGIRCIKIGETIPKFSFYYRAGSEVPSIQAGLKCNKDNFYYTRTPLPEKHRKEQCKHDFQGQTTNSVSISNRVYLIPSNAEYLLCDKDGKTFIIKIPLPQPPTKG